MKPFTEKTIEIIKSIPEGKIARAAGSPRGARQVVRILHSMSRAYGLPWHRVINAKGEIAVKDEESHFLQVSLLESEGIEMDENHRINVEQYRFYVEE
jgi:methylated-DNA-protein-cysteine methyltransferase related protein